MSLGDRIRAALHDRLNARFERRHGARLRRRQLADARGRVLEIGAGTGNNIPHYPGAVEELTVSDPSAAMLRRAARRARDWPGPRPVAVVRASAQDLPMPAASFDTVVCSGVLCSVPDQAAALAEVRRVLRPGGRLLFLEHVRSGDPRRARRQDRFDRPWGVLAGGCHPNRETAAALAAAGLEVRIEESGDLPGVPSLVSPYILGSARAPSASPGP